MGDTGSLIIGFLLAVQAIQFVGLNEIPTFVDLFGAFSPVMPLAILMIPLYDTLRVFVLRASVVILLLILDVIIFIIS